MRYVYDKISLSIKYQNMKLQNDKIRFVFPGFPLLLRLPSGNKVLKIKIIKTLFSVI